MPQAQMVDVVIRMREHELDQIPRNLAVTFPVILEEQYVRGPARVRVLDQMSTCAGVPHALVGRDRDEAILPRYCFVALVEACVLRVDTEHWKRSLQLEAVEAMKALQRLDRLVVALATLQTDCDLHLCHSKITSRPTRCVA